MALRSIADEQGVGPESNFALAAKPLSAEDAATVAIRDAIVSGRLVPGQRLPQAELAGELGVSRIPLRDALRRLEGDLVAIDGRRGCWVTALEASEIEELYEIRILLESQCAFLAVTRLSDQEAQYLAGLSEQMDQEQIGGHLAYQARRDFYSEFYAHANRPKMKELILQIRDNVGRYHVLRDVVHSAEAHEELRLHILARNPDGAAEAVVAHLEETRDDLLATMVPEESPGVLDVAKS